MSDYRRFSINPSINGGKEQVTSEWWSLSEQDVKKREDAIVRR
jgi:hypothetical protein